MEQARRFVVKTTQSIGAKIGVGKCGWRNHKTIKIGGTACKWAGITKTIDAAVSRLRGTPTNLVQIEHMDAFRLIERYDTQDALIYLDPPYVRSTRRSGALYSHELSEKDHEHLLDLIVTSKSKIIISGYDNDLYNKKLKGWYTDITMSQTTSTKMACEKIWMNYLPREKQITFSEILATGLESEEFPCPEN